MNNLAYFLLSFDFSRFSSAGSLIVFATLLYAYYLFVIFRATIEDPLPRTIENVRIRGIIQRTILQVSSGVGAVPRRNPTTTKRKTTKKRKSPTKKRKTTKR